MTPLSRRSQTVGHKNRNWGYGGLWEGEGTGNSAREKAESGEKKRVTLQSQVGARAMEIRKGKGKIGLMQRNIESPNRSKAKSGRSAKKN